MRYQDDEKNILDSLVEAKIDFRKTNIPGIDPGFLTFYARAHQTYQPIFPDVFRRMDDVINQARLSPRPYSQLEFTSLCNYFL